MFLLHDVFDFGYDEIAEIVSKTQDNCRQLAVRARKQPEARRPRFDTLEGCPGARGEVLRRAQRGHRRVDRAALTTSSRTGTAARR